MLVIDDDEPLEADVSRRIAPEELDGGSFTDAADAEYFDGDVRNRAAGPPDELVIPDLRRQELRPRDEGSDPLGAD